MNIRKRHNPSVSGGGQAQATRPLALADLASERKENLPRDYPRQPGDTIALARRPVAIEAGPAKHTARAARQRRGSRHAKHP